MKSERVVVTIICATFDEYAICKDRLRPQTERKLKNRRVSSWSDERLVVALIHAGPGKIQCASATQMIIDEFSPDLVIDVGAAGSLDPLNEIGCVVCVRNCFEYDVCPVEQFSRLSRDLTTSTVAANPDDLTHKILAEFFRYVTNIGEVPSVRFGNVASGEQNVADTAFRKLLQNAFDALACNWETAAA
jgi:adenosylhomocysteine nucleosidase